MLIETFKLSTRLPGVIITLSLVADRPLLSRLRKQLGISLDFLQSQLVIVGFHFQVEHFPEGSPGKDLTVLPRVLSSTLWEVPAVSSSDADVTAVFCREDGPGQAWDSCTV
jgi:hypothetical protein